MKILLIGDASNYHCTLAKGLARMGHDVTVASNGSHWMRTARDIDLSRRNSPLGGALLWLRLNTVLRSRLKGYDVVQMNNPVFIDLKPLRVAKIFEKLKRDNGAVFLTALGTDTPYVDMCLDDNCPLRYTDLRVGTRSTPGFLSRAHAVTAWQQPLLRDHCRAVYDNIDGVVSALYEYHLACARVVEPERLAYGGIPIDTASLQFLPIDSETEPINIMGACHKGREAEKGFDLMWPQILSAAESVGARAKACLVQNVPYAEFERILGEAHVVVDQLYSYTPATTALLAMARGKIAVSGGEEDFYRFIGEDYLRPIVNPDPTDPGALDIQLRQLLADGDKLHELSTQGRQFVEKHNDVMVVARRFTDFWERRLACR